MGRPTVAARSFPAEVASVPEARRFVRAVLGDAGHERWLDEALLATSELATNAVLHAHSAFEISVHVQDEGVYVQIWDDDPMPPDRRDTHEGSTTGRGLELVGAVATFHGVQTVGPSKVVWFSLGMPRPEGAADLLLDRWSDLAPEQPAGQEAPCRDVVLRGMPVQVWLAAREHHNALMREYTLQQHTAPVRGGDVLEMLVRADRARSLVLSALRAAGPAPVVDLVLQVRPEQAGWFTALRDVLDRAESLARSGELLAEPGPQVVVDVRRWACRQVLEQLAGAQAEPWAGTSTMPSAPEGVGSQHG